MTKAKPKTGPKLSITTKEFLSLKKPKGDLTLEVEGERVSLTSLDRVYWPTPKFTKFDLLCYYLKISSHIMPFTSRTNTLPAPVAPLIALPPVLATVPPALVH